MLIKRGDIFYADLNPVVGSEQGGIRPVLVVQNNVGNRHSPTIVVLPLSTAKKALPSHSYSYPRFKNIAQGFNRACGTDTDDRQIPIEKLRGFS